MTRRSKRGSGSIAKKRPVAPGAGNNQESPAIEQRDRDLRKVLPSWLLVLVAVLIVLAAAILGSRFMASRPIAAQVLPTIRALSRPISTSSAMAATYVGRET